MTWGFTVCGQAWTDFDIYTPALWANDPGRRRKAGIPPVKLSPAETTRVIRLARDHRAGTITAACLAFHLRWSDWRRRHQARARRHHYTARLAALAA